VVEEQQKEIHVENNIIKMKEFNYTKSNLKAVDAVSNNKNNKEKHLKDVINSQKNIHRKSDSKKYLKDTNNDDHLEIIEIDLDMDMFKEKQVENLDNYHKKVREYQEKSSLNKTDISINGTSLVFLKLNNNLKIINNKNNNIEEEDLKNNLQIKSSNNQSAEKALLDHVDKINQNQEFTHLAAEFTFVNYDAKAANDIAASVNVIKNSGSIEENKDKNERTQVDKTKRKVIKKKSQNRDITGLESYRRLLRDDKSTFKKGKKPNTKYLTFSSNNLKTEKNNDNNKDISINNINNKLAITNEIAVHFKGKKEEIKKQKRFIVKIAARNFVFHCKDSSKFSSHTISIVEASVFSHLMNLIKIYVKILLVGTIYLFIWFYIAIFVESIYKQYGKNVFKICVIPLISMLFIKLVIFVNIRLLIAACILYFKGKEYVNNKKNNLLMTIVFKALVPPLALNHFSAILSYQSFCEVKRRLSK